MFNHHSNDIHIFIIFQLKELLSLNTNPQKCWMVFLVLVVRQVKMSPKFAMDIEQDGAGIFQLFQAILVSAHHFFEDRGARVVGDHEEVEVFPRFHV